MDANFRPARSSSRLIGSSLSIWRSVVARAAIASKVAFSTYFPLAYHARKHHACLEKMKQRQQKSFAYHLPA